ncbi:SH3 domain-containing protein [Desulfobacter curvatus]|uniref:SH3 domain-containing protein n=1 Tax=Desulfobacter curvatus TaxID=2290 RepID=UPI00036A2D58|nr:SH3 domain-containing protein [Desulfobacter curvatus]
MKNVTILNFFLYGFILITFLNLQACTNQGFSGFKPFESTQTFVDDPCSENLYKLKSYDKSTTMNDTLNKTLTSWTRCMATCQMSSFLNNNSVACDTKCNKQIDTNNIVNSFISTSEQEQKRLQEINLEVDRLQQCRNHESKQILAGLKSKDPARRKKAQEDYKNFGKKIEADNCILDQLLAKSGKRIKEQEKTIAKIDKIEPGPVGGDTVPDTQVRSGYSIRTAPSTKTGEIIGKTGQTVKIKQIEGRWVSIYYPSSETAWVHVKAFPSITPNTHTTPQKGKTVHEVHEATKQQYAQSVEKKSDYAKDMDLCLSEMDEAAKGSA